MNARPAERDRRVSSHVPSAAKLLTGLTIIALISIGFFGMLGEADDSDADGEVVIHLPTQNGSCGSSLSWTCYTDLHSLVITGSGQMTNYLESSVRWNGNTVVYVSFPDGLTSIGNYAFCDTAVSSVTLPTGVTSIGNYSFKGCTSIQSLFIPTSVVSFGEGAFDGITFYVDGEEVSCTVSNITGRTWSGEGDGRLYYYSSHTVSFNPNGGSCSVSSMTTDSDRTLDSLPEPEFSDHIFLGWYTSAAGGEKVSTDTVFTEDTEIFAHWTIGGEFGDGLIWTITDDTLSITYSGTGTGQMSFNNGIPPWAGYSEAVTSLTIGEGVTSIAENAFYHYLFSSPVTIPDTVTYIGCNAFRESFGVECIELSNCEIDGYAFYNCKSIQSVHLGDGPASIGEYSFAGCTNLETIYLGKEVSYLGVDAFDNLPSVESIYFDLSEYTISDDWSGMAETPVFSNIGISTKGAEVVFGPNVTVVEQHLFGSNIVNCWNNIVRVIFNTERVLIKTDAFLYSRNLCSVELNGFVELEPWAFGNCNNLFEIVNNSDNLELTSGQYDDFTRYAQSITTGSSKLVLTDDGYIFGQADDGEYYLLMYEGFETDIVLPENYDGQSYNVGKYAFFYEDGYFFRSLDSVVIPDGLVKTVGNYTFYYCSSLKSLTIGDSVTSIGEDTCDYCNSLETLVIGDSVTSIGSYSFISKSPLKKLVIGNSLEEIGFTTFSPFTFYIDGNEVETNAENLRGKTWIGTGDGRLYSHLPHTITFDPNGGTCPVTDSITGIYGTLESLPVASRASYEFVGWFTHAVGGVKVTEDMVYNSDLTLYAYWKLDGSAGDGVTWSLAGGELCIDYTGSGDGRMLDYEAYSTPWSSEWESIRTIVIGDGVSSIGENAFVGCLNVTRIVFGNDLSDIAANSFGCTLYGQDRTTTLDPTAENLSGWTFVLEDEKMVIGIMRIDVTASDMSGSVSGGGMFRLDSSTTITAIPNDGYGFAGWYSDGNLVSTDPTSVIKVSGNAEYVAHFEAICIISIVPVTIGSVDYGTAFDALGLPSTVSCTTDRGDRVDLPVTWRSDDYDLAMAGTQTIGGTVNIGPYSGGPDLVAQATVAVLPPDGITEKEISYFGSSPAFVTYGTPFQSIEKYVYARCTDGSEIPIGVRWNSSEYDPYALGNQTVTGAPTIPYGYCLSAGLDCLVDLEIHVSVAIITSFVSPDMGLLPVGISVSDIGLPSTIGAYLASGSMVYLPVIWETDGLDLSSVGSYAVYGSVEIPEVYILEHGSSNTVTATFTLSEEMVGIADIVFLVDTTGSMADEINNVRLNISDFARQLEATGIYVRWALVEFRDVTCDGYSSTRIRLNGSENWYIDAESFATEIGRLSVNGGGDRAETVIQALETSRTLDFRLNAHHFFIVVTDADYKNSNSYGVSTMAEEITLLQSDMINVSVVADPRDYAVYRGLVDSTGGILVNIYGSFSRELMKIADMIGTAILYGNVTEISITKAPNITQYYVGESFDGTGMIVTATYSSGITQAITGYSVVPYRSLSLEDTEVLVTYRGCSVVVEIAVISNDMPVTGISLSESNVELNPGDVCTIIASVMPENASNKDVYWTSSNSNVVTVVNGKIVAKNSGSAVISAVTADGGYLAECSVYVNYLSVPAEGLFLNTGGIALPLGGTYLLTATVYPDDASDKNVIWESSDPSVASVESGTVTALSYGKAIISATDAQGHVQYCSVTVANYITVLSDNAECGTSNSFYAIPGTVATISAYPGTGYRFEGWYCNDVLVSEDTSFDFTVTGDAEYIAAFERIVIAYVPKVVLPNVPYGTDFYSLGLPSYVECFTSTGASMEVMVSWNYGSYSPTMAGTQNISGYLYGSGFVVADGVAPDATVTVLPGTDMEAREIVRFETESMPVSYGTPFHSIPMHVYMHCSDGYSDTVGVSWNTSVYDPYLVSEQTVTGTVAVPFGFMLQTGLSTEVELNITVIAATITSFVSPDMGVLPVNITAADIGLPSTIGANLSDGSVRHVPVSWNTDDLDLTAAGRAYVYGTADVPEGYALSPECPSVVTATFVLSSDMVGIADIVFLIDTTGSMSDEISNVRVNISTFARNLESTGISVRWALVEYRDITCDGYSSTKIRLNGSENWYIDAESFAAEIGRLSVNGGGDLAETAVDALEKARTLDFRSNASRFFIIVTDANYKVDNQFGVTGMAQEIGLLQADRINVSVVTDTRYYGDFQALVDATGGILVNINGSFSRELMKIADMIGTTMLYGEVASIAVTTGPTNTTYLAGQSFDSSGMVVKATYSSGITQTVTGYSIAPCGPLSMGTSSVTVSYRGCEAVVNITVGPNTVPVNGIELNVSSVTMAPGEITVLVATISPADASMADVFWTSSNPNAATVIGGKVLARHPGTSVITAVTADGGFTAECTVTVESVDVPAEGLYLSVGGLALLSGDEYTLTAAVYPEDATDRSVTWASSDTSVVTVSDGYVLAVAPGTAVISATDSAGHVQYCYVTVRIAAEYVLHYPDGTDSVYDIVYLVPGTIATVVSAEMTGYDIGDWYSEDVLITEGSFAVPYGDIRLHADATKKVFTVTIYDDESSVIGSSVIEYGGEFGEPTHLEKCSDEYYTYTFAGWRYADGSRISFPLTVVGDIGIYACFIEEEIYYTVSFYVNHELFYTYETTYGNMVFWPMAPSDIPSSPESDYYFVDWNFPSDTIVTGDFEIEALLEEVPRSYTYTYYVGDSVIHSGSAEHGTNVDVYEYVPAEGTVFDGWQSPQVNIEGGIFTMPTCDVSLFAVQHASECRITFMVDGEVYSEATVSYGDRVPALTAGKPSTVQYSYTFTGWYDASGYTVWNVYSDTVLYASFSEVLNSYYVIYLDRDGEVFYSCLMSYGSEIPELYYSDVIETDTHILSFAGWHGYTPGMTVTGRTVFTAMYSSSVITHDVYYYVDNVRTFRETHAAGETVSVRDVYSATGIVATPWDSERVTVSDGTFVMPKEDVVFCCYTSVSTATVRYYDQGDLFDTVTVEYGSWFPASASTPVKASTDEFLFWFSDWVYDNGASAKNTLVTSDVDVYSMYLQQTRVYQLDFYVGDENFASYVLPYGSRYVAPARIPAGYSDAYSVSTFAGWNIAADGSGTMLTEATITGNTEYHAVFSTSVRAYNVYYLSGTEILYTDSAEYGSTVHVRDVPTVEGHNSAWIGDTEVSDGTFVMPASDVTFRLDSVVIEYSIVFTDHDGTVLYSGTLPYGTPVPVPSPVRESSAANDYTFAGWEGTDGEPIVIPSRVISDINAKARYDSVARQYFVLFYDSDGITLLHSYRAEYGSTVTVPEPPTRESDTYVYTFTGWNGYTEGMRVIGRTVFTAAFAKELILLPEETSYTVVDTGGAFVSFTDENVDELKAAAEGDSSTTLTVTVSGGTVTFDSQAILSFAGGNDLSIIKLDSSDLESDVASIVNDSPVFEIYFGDNRTFNEGKATVTLPYELKDGEDPSYIVVYYISDGKVLERFECEYSNGYVTFVTNHFSTYAIVNEAPESDSNGGTSFALYIAIAAAILMAVGAVVVIRRH